LYDISKKITFVHALFGRGNISGDDTRTSRSEAPPFTNETK